MGERKQQVESPRPEIGGVPMVGCLTDEPEENQEIFEPRQESGEGHPQVKRQSSIIRLSTSEKDDEKEEELREKELKVAEVEEVKLPETPPRTPEPPLIPAYPNQSRSTWSLPKSMSG